MEEKEKFEEYFEENNSVKNFEENVLPVSLCSFEHAIKMVKHGDWTILYSLLKHTMKVDFDIDTLDEVSDFL